MRRILAAGALGGLCIVGAGWFLTRAQPLSAEALETLTQHPADATRGEAVFWSAGCAGCHAAPGVELSDPRDGWLVLAGGRRLDSPFGAFVMPNVSMDPVHGIGDWTLAEFAGAIVNGTSPQGQHYYPAFPYASYAGADLGDIADLWAFWQTLPADSTPSQPHEVGFPFNIRDGIGLWKAVFTGGAATSLTPEDPVLTRGRYLAEVLGHCGECHRPRNALGGQDRSLSFLGGPNPAGEGRIPSLPPEGWSQTDIALYLSSGFTPSFDVAGGAMAEVIASYRHVSEADRMAIAAYLTALTASPNQ